ncbi:MULTISPECIES: hypothetical protein [unclassified Pseudoalteromonas]|nr:MULTISPECIES: hypothetical protein [unclassified Pseudoalteromonas]MDN3378971.1 hypothetical protein [Pseudoalteromonas sp. APC 3893]MDN3387617.1 hypothetical protein [Pseudoalteromonas sp. APC 4017]
MSHARYFEFLGGVPDIIIPDNFEVPSENLSLRARLNPDVPPVSRVL